MKSMKRFERQQYQAKVEPYATLLTEFTKTPEGKITQLANGALNVHDKVIYYMAKATGLKTNSKRAIKKRGTLALNQALYNLAKTRG